MNAACVLVIYLHGVATQSQRASTFQSTVLGIPFYSFGDYERHNGYYCPLLPLMQRDDSANLGDIDDNNDDNTADGGGNG